MVVIALPKNKKDNLEGGFYAMAAELAELSEKITDEKTRKKVLEAGAEPVVERAKQIASRFKQSGDLVQSIGAEYSDKTETIRIGIGEPVSTVASATGFYGRFQDQGFQPVGGKRVHGKRRGRLQKRTKRPKGRRVQNPIFEPAHNIKEEQVQRRMLETYRKELK